MNNPNAARARKVALDRHRMQLRIHRMVIPFALIAGIVAGRQATIRLTEWRGGPPPPITKVKVVTYGFMDKEGVWRSYDNGEKITVTNWKP